MRNYNFSDKKAAKKAGRKGGKAVRPENRYFSVNREAAANAGKKSRYAPPRPKIVPDDTIPRSHFEEISGDYAKMVPWDKLDETTRQFWRKRAQDLGLQLLKVSKESLVVVQDVVDSATEINLLWDTSDLGQLS